MGRITARRPVIKITLGSATRKRADDLAVEEPLEVRVMGEPLAITMRTPGHDVELAAGFLVSEGVISIRDHFRNAIHCGGPGTPGGALSGTAEGNTYNVLDVALAPDVTLPAPELARNFYTTSSCGVCGKASIEAIETASKFDPSLDRVTISAAALAELPDRLREDQVAFARTGGLHAAGLYDAVSGERYVVREDVGRHNAVDKVIGWALLNDRLPLTGVVLQVSGRASFELVQKAVMAGVPILSAVSAPSTLAAELATTSGLTLAGFVRGTTMNVYSRAERILVD
ncbi:formate dehydrogenase accessory sulfurtransferase FdhD [Microbacterium sp. NPDC076911]|uniref:formate dehydrogenase accessory sulfurtransferase FdhD n=1 Tax=Microbacterium sp. NPDC076911 TaxID=3154958 RepID=UPI003441BD60